MPTTARPRSWTPSWRRASLSVASACTTWVILSDQRCTKSAFSSIARTSCPRRINDSATAPPNLPSPMTTTPPLDVEFLANYRTLLGKTVQPLAAAKCKCGRDGDATHAADEHQHDDHALRRWR